MDTLLCLLKRFRKLLDLASRKKFVSKEVRKAKEGGVKISAKNAAEAAATLSHVPTFSYGIPRDSVTIDHTTHVTDNVGGIEHGRNTLNTRGT